MVLTRVYLEALDQMVEKGFYLNFQDAIRDALMHLFTRHKIEPFSSELVEKNEKDQD